MKNSVDINWKHALGEVLLIVIGVLIALAVNDWNQGRQDRRAEARLRNDLSASLKLDVAAFDTALTRLAMNERGLDRVRAYLRGDRSRADSLAADMGVAYCNAGASLLLHTAAYETLKSRGLDLISNDSLRMQIVMLYDETYRDALASAETGESSVIGVLRPYFLSHFSNLTPCERADPLDAAALSRDPYFANILAYRAFVVQQNLRPTYEFARNRAGHLIEALAVK